MNDTTNPTLTAAVEDRHATKMEAVTLLPKLLAVFNEHIDQQVERKVNDIMQSHATMALIDEKMEDRLRDIAKEVMDEHEGDYSHLSNDDVHEEISTQFAHTDFSPQIRQAVEEIISDGDYVTEDRVVDIVTDEIDFEEKVKEVLRNI
jgi:hypothetical protein